MKLIMNILIMARYLIAEPAWDNKVLPERFANIVAEIYFTWNYYVQVKTVMKCYC